MFIYYSLSRYYHTLVMKGVPLRFGDAVLVKGLAKGGALRRCICLGFKYTATGGRERAYIGVTTKDFERVDWKAVRGVRVSILFSYYTCKLCA